MRPVGSIDVRNGRHRLRIRQPGAGRRTAGYYETREEAERMRDAILLQLAGTPLDPRVRGNTLGAYGIPWLDERERTHRDADGDRQRWNAYVAGTPLAGLRLASIQPRHVQRWINALAKRISDRTGERLDPQTVRNALTTLRACFRSAVEAELIEENPAASTVLPRGSVNQEVEDDEPIAHLDEPEIERVLSLPLTAAQRSAFVVAAFTGLRPSEMFRLRWSDVLLDERQILARRTKNGKAVRVELLPPAILALRIWRATSWRRMHRTHRIGSRVWPADGGGSHARGYDWGWTDGTAGQPGIRTRAKVRACVTWYAATRHTCGTHLLLGTWAPAFVPAPLPIEAVSRFLRHSSTAVTERHYARFTGGALRELLGGSRAGSRGSARTRMLSHLGDLNPRPTVYEVAGGVGDPGGLSPERTAENFAERVLRLAEAGDGRALAVAIEWAAQTLRRSAGAVVPGAVGRRA